MSKDLEGNVSVEQTDHMVEEGAAGLAPWASWSVCSRRRCSRRPRSGRPSARSAARLLHKKIGSKIEEKAGETIPIGGAGLIVAYPHKAAGKVEPAVTRAIKKVVGEAEGHHVKALKGALADAQQKMAAEGA